MYRQNKERKSERYRKKSVHSLDGGVSVPLSESNLPQGYPARPTSDAVCGYVGDVGPFYTKTTAAQSTSDGVPADPPSPCDLPQGYPARPTSDAVCGYIGDVGPFYTKTVLEPRVVERRSGRRGHRRSRHDEADNGGSTAAATQRFLHRQSDGWETASTDSSVRHVHFATNDDESGVGVVMSWYSFPSDTPRPIRESAWIRVSLGSLFASTLLLMVSFVTSSWGIMIVPVSPEESAWNSVNDLDMPAEPLLSRRWNFGLWQCCRDDGLCLGTKWPAFYTATRTFGVLSLFAHALTFAWMLGHTLEKLLNFDACTMLTLITNCFVTASFSLISVTCFGVMWPTEFSKMYPSTSTTLGYSYFLALVTIPLTVLAGICALVDFKGTWKAEEIRGQFGTEEAEEEEGEEEEGEAEDDVVNGPAGAGESRTECTSV